MTVKDETPVSGGYEVMTEAVAANRGRRLDGRYTLLDKLGAGGQAEVWRAHDAIRGVDIALKILNPSLQRDEAAWGALEHEYAIASLLDHPAILKVFPPERTGDLLVLPLELASGGDLRRLRGAGFLEIIPVLLEIAQALEHAHERGVVHRDLKPGNVLFDARGRARLADFGVAETASKLDAGGEVNRETSRHGFSPFTASPAQLRGEAPQPADDVYGLGALAYELLSGYPPYYPKFNKQRAIEEPVPDLVPTRQIPPLLHALVMRMLAKDPAQRPNSMREVIDELDAALNDTLTFDFETVLETPGPIPLSADGVMGPGPASAAATLSRTGVDLPALFASDEPAANMSEPPGAARWPADTGIERRAVPDRRQTRREPTVSMPQLREPPFPSGFAAGSPGGVPQAQGSVPQAQSGVPQPPGGVARSAAPQSARSGSRNAGTQTARSTSPNGESQRAESQRAGSQSAAAARSAESRSAGSMTVAAPWKDIPIEALPRVSRFDPIRPRRWPWVLFGLLVGAGAAVYFWLPRFESQSLPDVSSGVAADVSSAVSSISASIRSLVSPSGTGTATRSAAPAATETSPADANPSGPNPSGTSRPGTNPSVGTASSSMPAGSTSSTTTAASPRTGTGPPTVGSPSTGGTRASGTTASRASIEDRLKAMRKSFDGRLAMLEARGAGAWGGRDFAAAKTLGAESLGAHGAGNLKVAVDRLVAAMRLLDAVEGKAPQALVAEIAAGEKALGTGQEEVAGQAFALARRIDPNDRRASSGQRRAQSLNAVLPLLADAQNAESARDFARAAQDYSQALFLDPDNAAARAGQARANAAFGDDSYAKAIGTGFAALGAGRLDEAREAFVKARALKPRGAEAAQGLRRVGAALTARGFASIRQRAAGLEAQERWEEALQAYQAVLNADPSLAFAQEGKARTSSRAELGGRLQAFIDHPERLDSAASREEARSLLETAHAQSPSGPVLRSQMGRLEILLPGFDKPVRLSLVSDNSTQVAIASVGSFGAFARRDIQLRPGTYTVVGTRSGFRAVRRQITVAPGQETQTIRVTCSEPI